MDSEASAYGCATQRHHRYMIYGKKQRYIEVFQCSGDDMNLVLTGAVTPPSTKALLSPGTLTTQTPATFTHPPAPTPVPVPVPTAQPQPPPPPPLWDIHALVQAQAQAQAAQAQAQVAAQAQAAQAQAIRNQDFWLMALASNPPPTSTTSASPTSAIAATNKSLALPNPMAQAQIPAAYAVGSPAAAAAAVAAAAALHAPPATPAAAPFLFFNVPHHPRIPILRAPPTPHGLLTPIMHTAPALNPAAIMGLKRSWDAAFTGDAAASSVAAKRAAWHTPAAAFHTAAPTATPGLHYPTQFYPNI